MRSEANELVGNRKLERSCVFFFPVWMKLKADARLENETRNTTAQNCIARFED